MVKGGNLSNEKRIWFNLAKSKEQQESSSKPVNYTLFNQKITFEFLKAHSWAAADILRGSLDPAVYRQPIMTLLFIKRLNDTFEENAKNNKLKLI